MEKIKIFDIPLYKIIIYGLLLAILVFVLFRLNTTFHVDRVFSQDNIEAFIKSAGIFSWLVYVIIVTLMVMSPLSSPIMAIIAGYIFNPFLALGLTVVGEVFGAIGNFFIGKKIIKRLLARGRLPKISAMVEKYKGSLDSKSIFLMGIVPMGTSNMTGYIAGVTGLSLKKYLIPWMAGIITLTILTIYLGHSAKIHAPYLSYILGGTAILIFVLIKVLPSYLEKRRLK